MKKLLIIVGIFLVLLLGTAVVVPIVFKDDIESAIDQALSNSVNADIVWDVDDFSISLFTNFPNATVGLHNMGVINRAPFQGEILFAVESFEVELDIFSLFTDKIVVSGIQLIHPEINIHVLEDGTANYDIALEGEAPTDEVDTISSEAPAAFNIGIDHWSISKGHIIYNDATLPYKMEMKNLSHSGSGAFTTDVFDLTTQTTIDTLSVEFDGVEYLSNKSIDANITLTISDNYSKYTFGENSVHVNDFNLGFEGWLALNDDGSMDMDLTYGAEETTFKSLLSLVPGIYTQDFSTINTAGLLTFNGLVKGKYDSLNMPAFRLGLQVNDAMFKYPDLPTAISNISLDLLVDNKDGIIEHTLVDLKQFHMEFGDNPIDATLQIKNLKDYDMEAAVRGSMNLAQLNTMFPVDGMALKGAFNIDLKASGIYDSISGKTPMVDATMKMDNGYIKTVDLPYAVEDLAFGAQIKSPTGLMKDFEALITGFTMTIDGEPFKADLSLANLENYTWDLSTSGGVDLEKITKIFPLEGMQLAGKIKANMKTSGNMADLEAERYTKLPTSGSVNVSNFSYQDDELPYDVTIASAAASFDPKQITLKNYTGKVGKSDMAMSGSLSNYIGYIFGEGEVLKGTLDFSSNTLDLNEFMEEEEVVEGSTNETSADAEASTEEYGVVEIPLDIDFVLNSNIKKVIVMDMSLTNATGNMVVRDGVLNLNDLKFNMLKGDFAVSGLYDPRDTEKPKYDFKLKVEKLSSQEAFQAFSIVQSYFPIAKNVNGNLSTDFVVSGLLNQEMLPDMKTVSGAGLLNIAQAKLVNSKVIKSIGSVANVGSLSDTEEVSIKDILMNLTIEDGKVNVKPFEMELAGYKAKISGSSFLDGSLDYNLQVDLPAGKLGAKANDLIAQYSGGSAAGDNTIIPLVFGIGGTYTDPKPTLKTMERKREVTNIVKDVAKDKIKEETGLDVEAEKEKQRQKILAEAQSSANKIETEGKKAAEKVREEGNTQADRVIKEAGSNFLKKRVAEEAAKKIRKEANEKADKMESEAKKKADALLAEARKKAAAI